MTKLQLSLAIGDYDRTRPLLDGSVQIDGVNPVTMTLAPEEIFFRAFRHEEFDICELSLSSFAVRTATGDCPYVGVPAFVSRAFRHTSMGAELAWQNISSLPMSGREPYWPMSMGSRHPIPSGSAVDWRSPAALKRFP